MSTLRLAMTAEIVGEYIGSNDIAAPRQDLAKRLKKLLTAGTVADTADLVFADTRTLAASATENLDLDGGLTDAFGNALAFVEVVAILVFAAAANTNNVLLGGAASNGFVGPFADATDKLTIKPGGWAFLMAPGNPAYPVTAGTGDILKVANSAAGTAVTYDIIIVGRSA